MAALYENKTVYYAILNASFFTFQIYDCITAICLYLDYIIEFSATADERNRVDQTACNEVACVKLLALAVLA